VIATNRKSGFTTKLKFKVSMNSDGQSRLSTYLLHVSTQILIYTPLPTPAMDIGTSMWTVWCKAIGMIVLNMTLDISGSTSKTLFMVMNTILYQKGDITAIYLVVYR